MHLFLITSNTPVEPLPESLTSKWNSNSRAWKTIWPRLIATCETNLSGPNDGDLSAVAPAPRVYKKHGIYIKVVGDGAHEPFVLCCNG
ncbi:uncharacterized protein BO97DRAFT_424294 [Aspergillus homomorphus CBS 101889]|uniref:Uncharacterized protein n=1 Tax=Aspergillus homomorphus (strain CBS 101889) TaxID=1450537 RepID=A0A395HYS0_ASPHC|nr:hypothetical protein BO97DRAFT_424294 [Aspergillus homomorphus CBS 101889]RAL12659.1 hypothetical protein BO97DRAFT_424294 [Aspergillus homomorphus CBS 101889]